VPVGALSRAAAGGVGTGGVSRGGIWERLGQVPDGRSRRGQVYPLTCLAAVWLCALTAAGHDRVSAVGAWLKRTTDEERARLRLPWDPLTGYRLPSASTIHRFLRAVDDGKLAVALLDPSLDENPPADGEEAGMSSDADADPPAGDVAVVSAIAVDGKTSRHAKRADGSQVHLVGAVTHGDGRLVGQVEVDSKTNETTVFRRLLRPLDLTNVLVTADALHTVRSNLDWLVSRKKAHYLAVVKKNQPNVWAYLAGLPWAGIPTGDTTRDHGHGRDETRGLKAATVAHIDFPHALQAIRIQRWRQVKGRPPTRETVYGITDLAFEQAGAALLAAFARHHWHCENRQHYVRDVTFGEDASTSRTGRAPAALAVFRGAVINAIRAAGYRYIPEGRLEHVTATAALNLHGFPRQAGHTTREGHPAP
jgi:predicted transposase YbfD/YdcC